MTGRQKEGLSSERHLDTFGRSTVNGDTESGIFHCSGATWSAAARPWEGKTGVERHVHTSGN
jgi:hypothetical protein